MNVWNSINKSSQSHLGRARHYPHIRECTLPLRVLAVACTMRNEAYGALRIVTEHYGALTEPLRKISILPITIWILNFAHH